MSTPADRAPSSASLRPRRVASAASCTAIGQPSVSSAQADGGVRHVAAPRLARARPLVSSGRERRAPPDRAGRRDGASASRVRGRGSDLPTSRSELPARQLGGRVARRAAVLRRRLALPDLVDDEQQPDRSARQQVDQPGDRLYGGRCPPSSRASAASDSPACAERRRSCRADERLRERRRRLEAHERPTRCRGAWAYSIASVVLPYPPPATIARTWTHARARRRAVGRGRWCRGSESNAAVNLEIPGRDSDGRRTAATPSSRRAERQASREERGRLSLPGRCPGAGRARQRHHGRPRHHLELAGEERCLDLASAHEEELLLLQIVRVRVRELPRAAGEEQVPDARSAVAVDDVAAERRPLGSLVPGLLEQLAARRRLADPPRRRGTRRPAPATSRRPRT